MTQDVEFIIGDKEIAEIKNNKLATIQDILDDSELSPEDLTQITQAIREGAQDSLQDLDNDEE